jgi:hypothetical protein
VVTLERLLVTSTVLSLGEDAKNARFYAFYGLASGIGGGSFTGTVVAFR